MKLDEDEINLLNLPPTFAVRKRLDSTTQEVDIEMGMAMIRYQINKENQIMDIESEEDGDVEKRKRMRLNSVELKDLEEMERLDAEIIRDQNAMKEVNRR